VAENATTVAKQTADVFAEQFVRVILPPSGDHLLA
jgi:hypothetical protein